MTRRVRAAAAALAVGLGLSACGFGGSDAGEDGGSTTLNLLVPSYSDGTQALWQGMIKDFQAANPGVKVALEVQSWDNINDVVRTKIQADKAPDILNIDAYGGFARDALLYPASEVASEKTLSDFQESFVQNASLDGTMYGFPLIASTRTLFYNKELLSQAGVGSPPKTWAELLAAAKKVSALGGGVYGYGMPLGNEEAQAETSIWTFGNGGTWADGAKITVDTPENLEAVEFMQRLIDEKATQPNPGASDRTPLINVFIQGKIGMIEGLPPIVDQIEQKNPQLDYALAPIPTEDGSPVTLGVADHLMAFKNDDAKKSAIKKFMDFFFSTQNYLKFVDTEGFLPTTQSGAEGTKAKEKFAQFLAFMPNAEFYPSNNQAWSATQGAIQTLVGQIGQGKEPKSVLGQIQDKADEAAS